MGADKSDETLFLLGAFFAFSSMKMSWKNIQSLTSSNFHAQLGRISH